jgi:hypothetical protein
MLALALALALTPVQDRPTAWIDQIDPVGWRLGALAADTVVLIKPAAGSFPKTRPRLWVRTEKQAGMFLTLVSLVEFDCRKGRTRAHAFTGYAERNMGGKAEASIHRMPEPWRETRPGSMMDGLMGKACEPPAAD